MGTLRKICFSLYLCCRRRKLSIIIIIKKRNLRWVEFDLVEMTSWISSGQSQNLRVALPTVFIIDANGNKFWLNSKAFASFKRGRKVIFDLEKFLGKSKKEKRVHNKLSFIFLKRFFFSFLLFIIYAQNRTCMTTTHNTCAHIHCETLDFPTEIRCWDQSAKYLRRKKKQEAQTKLCSEKDFSSFSLSSRTS